MRARASALALALLVVSSVAFAQKKPSPAPSPKPVLAGGTTPVIVSVQSTKRIKVQVSEGSTMPCDSLDNRMLFNSTLGNGQAFQGATDAACVCVRHTTDAFPTAGWSESKMVCRPRACKGKVCKPASDQPIKIDIRASQT